MELNAKDAITLLLKNDSTTRIMVEGYEGGFSDPDMHFEYVVKRPGKTPECEGKYDRYDPVKHAGLEPIRVLVLKRDHYNF